MDELRKVQKVGYSTLAVSIPKELAKSMNLKAGDTLLFRQESDGTLRLIPKTGAKKSSKLTIKLEQVGSDEMLSELIVGGYALGYDTIEIVGKGKLDEGTAGRALGTMRRLRGLEVVESDDRRVVAQSFMDPTKFPVDLLIKRLRMLVSMSIDNVKEALDLRRIGSLNEVRRIKDEIDELYWLIVRQLLVALDRRELASEIGIESPLHASGDRVSAKTIDEIGGIVLDVAEELVRLKSRGTGIGQDIVVKLRRLAEKAGETFDTTVESLLTPDIGLLDRAVSLVDETLRTANDIAHGMPESGEHGYARVIVSHFAQLARYCNIMVEISSHRLLRKTSRLATVQ